MAYGNSYYTQLQRAVEVNFVAPAGALMPASIGVLDNHNLSADRESLAFCPSCGTAF